MNTARIRGAEVNLDQVSKLKTVDDLRRLEIFIENAEELNKQVWDAAQKLKPAKRSKPKNVR